MIHNHWGTVERKHAPTEELPGLGDPCACGDVPYRGCMAVEGHYWDGRLCQTECDDFWNGHTCVRKPNHVSDHKCKCRAKWGG